MVRVLSSRPVPSHRGSTSAKPPGRSTWTAHGLSPMVAGVLLGHVEDGAEQLVGRRVERPFSRGRVQRSPPYAQPLDRARPTPRSRTADSREALERVELLTEKLNQKSSNSHRPPSSDGPGAGAGGCDPLPRLAGRSDRAETSPHGDLRLCELASRIRVRDICAKRVSYEDASEVDQASSSER
jgi:hypothetical protein